MEVLSEVAVDDLLVDGWQKCCKSFLTDCRKFWKRHSKNSFGATGEVRNFIFGIKLSCSQHQVERRLNCDVKTRLEVVEQHSAVEEELEIVFAFKKFFEITHRLVGVQKLKIEDVQLVARGNC